MHARVYNCMVAAAAAASGTAATIVLNVKKGFINYNSDLKLILSL